MPDLQHLKDAVDAAKRPYFEYLRRLQNVVPDAELRSSLLTWTSRIGPEAALQTMQEAPEAFGIGDDHPLLTVKSAQVLTDVLTKLHEAEGHLDVALSRREAAFRAKDPNHLEVFIHAGREFHLDTASGRVTFLDGGTEDWGPPELASRTDKPEVRRGRGRLA